MKGKIACRDVVEWAERYEGPRFHALLCDPPYGLGFMGKDWDRFSDEPRRTVGTGGTQAPFAAHSVRRGGVAYERWARKWAEALLPLLYPGAPILCFGGTRTFHRLICGIEDAGFEIRDCLMWVYGSGFPKSLDVSKAIDRAAGAKRTKIGSRNKSGMRGANTFSQDRWTQANRGRITLPITCPATDAAKQWDGYGTALKPAWEPIILGRRPLEGTVAGNVQKWGTGALNIDGCRIVTGEKLERVLGKTTMSASGWKSVNRSPIAGKDGGRWPANLIHDGSKEVLELFPQKHGGFATRGEYKDGQMFVGYGNIRGGEPRGYGDSGSVARFFYCAKASRSERERNLRGRLPCRKCRGVGTEYHIDEGRAVPCSRNDHPTVKPLALCRYLAALLLPPVACACAPRRILIPFSGSGSEAIGSEQAGWDFAQLIDSDPRYCAIARARLSRRFPRYPLFPRFHLFPRF